MMLAAKKRARHARFLSQFNLFLWSFKMMTTILLLLLLLLCHRHLVEFGFCQHLNSLRTRLHFEQRQSKFKSAHEASKNEGGGAA